LELLQLLHLKLELSLYCCCTFCAAGRCCHLLPHLWDVQK
jgi:hypothetical protein